MWNRLAESQAIGSPLSVQVIKIEAGSVIITLVVSFPENAVPSPSKLQEVLSSNDVLIDGNTTIQIDSSSISVRGTLA